MVGASGLASNMSSLNILECTVLRSIGDGIMCDRMCFLSWSLRLKVRVHCVHGKLLPKAVLSQTSRSGEGYWSFGEVI